MRSKERSSIDLVASSCAAACLGGFRPTHKVSVHRAKIEIKWNKLANRERLAKRLFKICFAISIFIRSSRRRSNSHLFTILKVMSDSMNRTERKSILEEHRAQKKEKKIRAELQHNYKTEAKKSKQSRKEWERKNFGSLNFIYGLGASHTHLVGFGMLSCALLTCAQLLQQCISLAYPTAECGGSFSISIWVHFFAPSCVVYTVSRLLAYLSVSVCRRHGSDSLASVARAVKGEMQQSSGIICDKHRRDDIQLVQ